MRLSPMYYLFTFIAYKLSVHFGQGPLWYSHDYHTCTSTWWYNIFYLNNLLESSSSCVLATWHICADLQLFILPPIFIVLLHRSPCISWYHYYSNSNGYGYNNNWNFISKMDTLICCNIC